MTADIAAILAIDGIATGAVYALVAIGTVLIFTVTRVIFIPFGDIAAFTALTLAALDAHQLPGTVGLVVVLACMACVMEVASLARAGELRSVPKAILGYLVLPLIVVGIVWLTMRFNPPAPVRIVLALLLIMPVAPLLDRTLRCCCCSRSRSRFTSRWLASACCSSDPKASGPSR
jgi:branched-chain amino acid transport system permease protein